MSKPPPPAPTGSTAGPCPTIIQIVGRPGTGNLPSTIAPPDHPRQKWIMQKMLFCTFMSAYLCVKYTRYL